MRSDILRGVYGRVVYAARKRQLNTREIRRVIPESVRNIDDDAGGRGKDAAGKPAR